MPGFEAAFRDTAFTSLQPVLGMHKWVLNLHSGVMQVEYGREFADTRIHQLTIEQLGALLSPDDMKAYREHWEAGLRFGQHGPVQLAFANAAGEKSIVESACALITGVDGRYLVGYFKRVSHRAELGRNARMLTEFLESFIEHSPSGIVVVDHQGTIVSANREFIRFVGKAHRSEVVQNNALDMIYAISDGLGHVVRESLRATKPLRGRYEVTFQNGLRQTLYWRSFPLSMNAQSAPPHVFAFDLNENGARRVAA